MKRYSLYEANSMVREAIACTLDDEYWIETELSEVRVNHGHAFLELVETSDSQPKGQASTTPIARASAKCWQSTWSLLHPYFQRVAGQPLHAGMRVLLKARPQFHEAYGFSWIVTDINPEYTLGDMARRRQEIIKQLQDEGVFDLQRQLQMPLFAQRIAVISSASAAGYGDFCHQLENNEYGFVFHTELFPAVMQGDQVEASVIAALDQIYNQVSMGQTFDAVVIIRGGGATADLSGFDTLALAENVANFPLPVITGIGHDRDQTILDIISHTSVKTPTAAAALFIDRLHQVALRLSEAEQSLRASVDRRLQHHRIQLEHLSQLLAHLPQQRIDRGRHILEMYQVKLNAALQRLLDKKHQQLATIGVHLKGFDPQRILQRGYSITLVNGRVVRNASELKEGDELETRLSQGVVHSVVK